MLSTFQNLDSSGNLGGECWNDYEKKIDFWNEKFVSTQDFLKNWQKSSGELRKLIKTPEEIVQGLVSSGSAIAFSDLEPSISEQVARWAVSNCHLMRNRFVGIDLLEFLGLWTDSEVNWVFDRAYEAIKKVGAAA